MTSILTSLFVSFFILFSVQAEEPIYLTIGEDAYAKMSTIFGERLVAHEKSLDTVLVSIDEAAIPWLSMQMHKEFKRCGGFFWHEDENEAYATLENLESILQSQKALYVEYEINKQSQVIESMALIEGTQISSTIEELSAFHNRYYTSASGAEATEFIAQKWRNLVAHRSDASVELFRHGGWPQASVILTIQGVSDEIIIVGGHADSTAGFMGQARSRAPGADDNASGIATMTEVIRVLMGQNYRPQKTLKFMAYAAEEVGLRGSQEIAQLYQREGRQVIGVLQLDMTNFPGPSFDIVLISDFTNAEQNAFIGSLVDQYLPELSWGYDRCGYACSDHASWTRSGFPASIPFEATNRERNPHIHTARDTLDRLSADSSHAAKFARLAVAYVIEMD
jgi:bacterial leucyl aminopeptidase